MCRGNSERVLLLAHVGTGRWASIVPQTWLHALRLPPGVRALRLENPSVTAVIALVANAGEPSSVLTRALLETAHTAGISTALDGPPAGG